MKTYSKYLYTLGVNTLALCVMPTTTLHAQDFEPLIAIPGVTSGGDFSQYFNSIFDIALLIGAILAVIMIAASGIQYMTTDAITQKKDSVLQMRTAVIGLLMLLGTYLFFNQINPDILNLRIGATTPSEVVTLLNI